MRLGRFDSHRHCIIPLYASPGVFSEPWFPDLTAAILSLFSCLEAPRLRFLINALAWLAQPAVYITVGASSFGQFFCGVGYGYRVDHLGMPPPLHVVLVHPNS